MTTRTLVRVAIMLLVALVSALGISEPAFSVSRAVDTAQLNVGSGDWAEVIRTRGSSVQTGSAPITQSLTGGAGAVYSRAVELANVGTLGLLSASIRIAITRTSGSGTPTVTAVIVGCRNGTWSAAATPVCSSGTTVSLGSFSGGVGSTPTLTPTFAMAANETLPLRVAMTSTRTGTFVFAPSVSIARTRAQAAQTRTS